MTAPRFLAACRQQPTDRTPVWFMRQAGRYMPAYRALRERYGILDLIQTPDLAVEVTLQPMRAFPLDAAIIFADILTLLIGMGFDLEFVRGEGPLIHNPIRSAADIARLADPPIEESIGYTLEAIRLARTELKDTPLIGFSGAPFTLASYAIEGGPSRQFPRVKALMHGEPALWQALMTRLATRVGHYLAAQAAAGAQALQLFDSWVGELSPADYRQFVLPYSRLALDIASPSGVPLIHFSTGTSGHLDDIAAAGGDVIGVDWRIDLGRAWSQIGDDRAIQGNLDPLLLQAPWPRLQAASEALLRQTGWPDLRRPGHVFNLGHGILPETPMDNVLRLVEWVHEVTGEGRDPAGIHGTIVGS